MESMRGQLTFLKNNAGVYNWITVTEPDGTKFRYELGKKTFRESADGEDDERGAREQRSEGRDHGKRNIGSDGMV